MKTLLSEPSEIVGLSQPPNSISFSVKGSDKKVKTTASWSPVKEETITAGKIRLSVENNLISTWAAKAFSV